MLLTGDDSSSDSEHQRVAAASAAPLAGDQQGQPQYYQDPALSSAPLPDETASGSSVSSSDRESVEEAREDYQHELASGDRSDIEEAREEYEEEVEETYGSD